MAISGEPDEASTAIDTGSWVIGVNEAGKRNIDIWAQGVTDGRLTLEPLVVAPTEQSFQRGPCATFGGRKTAGDELRESCQGIGHGNAPLDENHNHLH
jgi:hypothetical protein